MSNVRKDKIKGGLADKKKPSAFNPKSLKAGTKVEMEHTDDKSIAREIAMDHLVEDKNYYKKLKTIEKSSFVEVAADGKRQIVQGKESLKKPAKKTSKKIMPELNGVNPKDPVLNPGSFAPKALPENKQTAYADKVKRLMQKGLDLQHRWDLIKRNLDNASAILNLEEESQPDEQQQEQGQEGSEQDAQVEQAQAESPDEQQEQAPQEQEGQDSEQEMQEAPPQQGQEQGQEQEQPDMPPEQDDAAAEQKIIESMRQEGFSDAEIAYVVHGHTAPEIPHTELAAAEAKRAMSDAQVDATVKSSEAELEMRKKQMELEHQHNQRMKDLEYDNAKGQSPDPEISKQIAALDLEERKLQLERSKQEMELELEFKRKELELKLKNMEAAAAKKLEQQSQKNKGSGASDEQD